MQTNQIVHQVASLKTLAARKIQNHNPNLFFQFHNRTIASEIEKQYISPAIEKRIQEAESHYLQQTSLRQDKVETLTNKIGQKKNNR